MSTVAVLDLADLGFLPVRCGERHQRIIGWLLTHEDAKDPDLQLVFIGHDGKIRLGVLEREMMDYNQNGWLVARDYFTKRPLAKWQDDDSLLIGDAPSSRPDDIIEELKKSEFREHLANPKYQHSRGLLMELLNTLRILDAPSGELQKHIQYSNQQARKVQHFKTRKQSQFASGTTETGITLRMTDAYDPHQHRGDIMRHIVGRRGPNRSA